MKKTALIAVLLTLAGPFNSFAQPDDASREALEEKMDEYLEAMDHLAIPYAEAEVDFMIGSVADSLLRNDVAVRAYNHFRYSKVMGSENVAVHIYDKWFATFRTVFRNIEDLDEAEFYAFLNRGSLIGAQAAPLEMTNADGNAISLPIPNGRRCVIYFYSVGCPKCLYTSLKLCEYLRTADPSLDIFAIYTGDNDSEWAAYINRELKIKAPSSAVYHLKGGDSDYVRAYGVVQTPRLFLVDGNGRIIGRNLDVDALQKLLD